MPTRILRDGIIDSKAVNALSEPAEILYRRLMSVVDDYGRFEADPELIRARCFPRQLDRWSVDRIDGVLQELTVKHGDFQLITVYSHGSKKLLQINNFGQRVQAKEKYPAPTSPESTVIHGDPPPSRSRSRSSEVVAEGEGVVVLPKSVAKPISRLTVDDDFPIPLTELEAAWDRHLKHASKREEPQMLVFQTIHGMNGKFDVKRFRERHGPYCDAWDRDGWQFCPLTFLGWIEAGMPAGPKPKESASERRKREEMESFAS